MKLVTVVFLVPNDVSVRVRERRLVLVMLLLILNVSFHLLVVVRVFQHESILAVDTLLDAFAIFGHWCRRRLEKVQRFAFVLCRKTKREL